MNKSEFTSTGNIAKSKIRSNLRSIKYIAKNKCYLTNILCSFLSVLCSKEVIFMKKMNSKLVS